MKIALKSGRVARWLAAIAVCLVVAHVATKLLSHHRDDAYLAGLGPLFNLDEEANLPTFYSILTLLLASAVLAGIASCEKGDRSRYPYWLGLSVIFALLAVDEGAQLHELSGNLLNTQIPTGGYLYYSWVAPYSVLLVVLLALFAGFVFRLPSKVRALVICAGVVFVAGAVGLESLAGHHDELLGQDNLAYAAMSMFEEILEMTGMAIFIYALLTYAEQRHGELSITIGRSPSD